MLEVLRMAVRFTLIERFNVGSTDDITYSCSLCMVWYGISAFFVQLRLAFPLGPSVYRLMPSDLCSLGGYPTTDSTWTLVAASAEGTRCYSRRSDRHPSLREIFSGTQVRTSRYQCAASESKLDPG